MAGIATISRATAPVASGRYVVSVELESLDGRRWRAIGGGANLSDALAFARESAPAGHWRVVRIDDLYGD
jgi:hypothetical protein